MQRLFIGGQEPTLPAAVRVLRERHAHGGAWDLGRVAIAVPGSRAARRLRRLLQEEAARAGTLRLTEPDILTPAGLLEKLCGAPNMAGPQAAHFAWVQACHAASAEDKQRLAPWAQAGRGPDAWADIAREAQQARAAAAAECLSLGQIAARIAALPGENGGAHWQALARLEQAYLQALARCGLTDRDEALRDGLAAGPDAGGQERCRQIYLVGAQDLDGLERTLLGALNMGRGIEVTAIVPASEGEQDKFDEAGSLRTDAWHNHPIDIPDAALQFVGGPSEEAHALRDAVAALDGAFSLQEITVGAGDEAGAQSLARRLAILELPSYSPFGRAGARVGPAAFLGAARAHLHGGTAGTFADWARHPDMEAWLASQAAGDSAHEKPLLSHLDTYCAECLPHAPLPTGADAQALRESPCPHAARAARAAVLDAHEAADALLAPVRGAARPLGAWAAPITDLLLNIYADAPLDDTPAGRQLARALAALAAILGEMGALPPALAPTVSGLEALVFVGSEAEAVRLPAEPAAEDDGAGLVGGAGLESGAGLEMIGWLELALDDAPVLLLTGLQEGCVPGVGGGDDRLLPDSLRRMLGLADDRRRLARDGWLLGRMIESRRAPGRHVRLFAARAGADGDPRLPSRLLFACAPEQAARRAALWASLPQNAAPAQPLFRAGSARALPPPHPSGPEAPLSEMSVSAFADYLACPYRFHLRHILGLREQDDSRAEMDPRLFGILLHDCLAAFAQSDAAQSSRLDVIKECLQSRLASHSRKRFGANPSRIVEVQIRQAGRRLDAFAAWQAQSVRDGWTVQPDLTERELTVSLRVDGTPFTIKGRMDRVDYHAGSDQYRIVDYKTGDAGEDPDARHRTRGAGAEPCQWTDLQLPLYRHLLAANGAGIAQVAPDAVGYVLLSADLAPVAWTPQGRRTGGAGFVPAPWTQADHDDALRCAEGVVRSVRAGMFWPPAHPSPFALPRTDPGRSEAYDGLCLDSCSDRREWFQPGTEAAP